MATPTSHSSATAAVSAPSRGIVVEHVSKLFKSSSGPIQALKDVSFQAPSGKALSILGSNGAGKTTLINILTTVIRPDSGQAWINGHDVQADPNPIRQELGVVSQSDRFDTYLTLWENLSLHAELHGMPKSTFTPKIEHLLRQVDLYDRRHAYIDTFSGGMKRKASLIRALIHEPTILFLDEPTTGLDPLARRQVWDAIRKLKEGRTLVLTTHYMQEADELSDHIVLMDQGTVLRQGTPTELKQQVADEECRWHYTLALKQPIAHTLLTPLQAIFAAEHISVDIAPTGVDALQLSFAQKPVSLGFIAPIINHLNPDSFLSLHQQLPSLETVFFNAIGEHPQTLIGQ